MTTLDVSLRLGLVNAIPKGAAEARKEIEKLTAAARKTGVRRDGMAPAMAATAKAAQGARGQVDALDKAMRRAGARAGDVGKSMAATAKASERARTAVTSMSGALKTSWAPAIAGARGYAVALDKVRYSAQAAKFAFKPRAPIPAPRKPTTQEPFSPPRAPGAPHPAPAGGGRRAAMAGMLGAQAAEMGSGAFYGLAGAAAGAMGVAGATQKALSLEKVMYDVQKATDASGAALKRYETFLNDTSRATGKSAEDLGQMLSAAGYAGRPVSELTRFVEYAAKATNAWGIAAEQTGQAMAEIGNIYQADQTRIEQIGDAINFAADTSAARESDLLDFIRRTGGAAKAQGIGAEQTLAFGAALKEMGISTEVAATGFNAFLNTMTLGEEANDKQQEALKKLGTSAEKMAKQFSKKPVEAMVDLLNRINGVGDGIKRNQILLGLFDKEYADDIGRYANAVPRLKELLGKMADKTNYLGGVSKSFELMKEKDFNRLERAQAAIDQMRRTIGVPLKVAAGELAAEFNQIAERIVSGANVFERWRAERDAYDEAMGRKKDKPEAPKHFGTGLDNYVFGEEGKRDEQLRQAKRMGYRKAAESRRAEEDAVLRRRTDVQRRYDVRRSRGYYNNATPGAEPDALQRELDHLDEVARRIHQARAAAEQRFAAITASLGDAQAQQSQVGRWGGDPTAKPWAQTPDKAPGIGSVSPGLSMMPLSKKLTGKKSAPWMQTAAAEATKLSIAVQDAADKANTLSTALGSDLSGSANSAMTAYNAALQAGVERALSIAKAGAAALQSALSFSAAPTIAPRLAPAGATAAPTGGKRSAMRSGGNISIAQANFHGVKDVGGMKRQLMAQADRSARGARGGALHDVDTA